MRRRDFLTRIVTAASLAAHAKAQSGANAAKLTRISMMTYNFRAKLKLPIQPPSPDRTIAVLDIPQMFADTWGIHNVEFQHSHIESTETSYLNELKSRVAKAGSKMTQINVEFGDMTISAANPVQRDQAIDLTMRWVDHAVVLGCPRVMINQGRPFLEATVPAASAALRRMTEYAKTKDVKISVETRLPGQNEQPGRWDLVKQLVENSGAYSNVDIGNTQSPDQASIHAAIKGLLPSNSGNMHIKVSPNWDLGTAIRYTNNDLGYKGLYSIEVDPPQIQSVYETLLASI